MLKKIAKKLLPSLYYGNQIIKSIDYVENQQTLLNQRISNLDKKHEYLFWINHRQNDEPLSETKKRVFYNLPKAEGKARDTQLVNLYILKKLKEICDQNDIHFFLLFGTLIGAIRHEGYIPWDDDIDIGMLYTDYIRLKSVLLDNSELYMQTYYNYNHNSHRIKVRLKQADPFFVDIFLLDFFHDCNFINQELIDLSNNYANKLKDLFKQHYNLSNHCPPFLANSEIESQMEHYYNEMLKGKTNIGSGDSLMFSICCDVSLNNFILNKNDVFPLIKTKFEKLEFEIPNESEKILKMQYKDIWEFPSDISPNHSSETEIDYKKYQELISTIKKELNEYGIM